MPGDAASIEIAKINADAQLGASNAQTSASMANARAASDASMFGSNADLEGRRIASDASRYGADQELAGRKYAVDRPPDRFDLTRSTDIVRNGLSSDPLDRRAGYSQGTPRVPGHGDGTVDTVDAKLAPGEAVLNKAAAEMLGRGLIDLLNKHGMLQMGMPEPDEDDMTQGEPQHHAAGCSSVRKYAAGTSNVGFKTSQDERATINGGGQTPSFDYAGAARSLRSR